MTTIDPKAGPLAAFRAATSPGSERGTTISPGEFAGIRAAFDRRDVTTFMGMTLADRTRGNQESFLKTLATENPALAQVILNNGDWSDYVGLRTRHQHRPEIEEEARSSLRRQFGESGQLPPARERLSSSMVSRIDQLKAELHAEADSHGYDPNGLRNSQKFVELADRSLASGPGRELVNQLLAERGADGRPRYPDAQAMVREILLAPRRR